MKRKLGRREFLKRAAVAAAIPTGTASAAAQTEKESGPTNAILTRALGKTGVRLPILGYGGAALPKAWLNPLSHEERVELVRYAYD